MSIATPMKKKTSAEQLNYMVDFIVQHQILLHGKTKPSEANMNIIEKLWDELTTALNAIGSGPTKTKLQWKKTFVDWKSHTKKKSRECYKSMQRTGGGETDTKKLTPLEEKLMSLLSWLTVSGANVTEIGLEDENRQVVEETDDDGITNEERGYDEGELDGIEPLNPTCLTEASVNQGKMDGNQSEPFTLKRPAEPMFSETKKKKSITDKTSNLQKAIETYNVGQKQTTSLLDKLLSFKNSSVEDNKLKDKELELKEMELKIRFLEAKNKARELSIRETELKMEAKKNGYAIQEL